MTSLLSIVDNFCFKSERLHTFDKMIIISILLAIKQ